MSLLTHAVCGHSSATTHRNSDEIFVRAAAFQKVEPGIYTRHRHRPKGEVTSTVTVQHAAL